MLPYAGSHLAPSAVGVPAPVVISPGSKSLDNLASLYKMTPEVVPPAPLDRAGYPHPATFWDKDTWIDWVTTQKEKTKASKSKSRKAGEGYNSSFIVTPNGVRVNLSRQQTILGEARRTWNTMVNFEVPLMTHKKIAVPALAYFRARMESMFLELRLCDNHWKADRLWQENFSSWRSTPPEAQPEKVSGSWTRRPLSHPHMVLLHTHSPHVKTNQENCEDFLTRPAVS